MARANATGERATPRRFQTHQPQSSRTASVGWYNCTRGHPTPQQRGRVLRTSTRPRPHEAFQVEQRRVTRSCPSATYELFLHPLRKPCGKTTQSMALASPGGGGAQPRRFQSHQSRSRRAAPSGRLICTRGPPTPRQSCRAPQALTRPPTLASHPQATIRTKRASRGLKQYESMVRESTDLRRLLHPRVCAPDHCRLRLPLTAQAAMLPSPMTSASAA